MTLRTRLNLECAGCGRAFPRVGNSPSPVDGSIYTPVMLRDEAADEGWVRVKVCGDRDDLCPRCAKLNEPRGKKGGRS